MFQLLNLRLTLIELNKIVSDILFFVKGNVFD